MWLLVNVSTVSLNITILFVMTIDPMFFYLLYLVFLVAQVALCRFLGEQAPSVDWTIDFNQPYVCGRCGRTYKHKYNLMRHAKIECGHPPTFSCTLCCYKGFHRHQYQRHLETNHGVHTV